MFQMFYKNARIYTSDFHFRTGAFEVTEDGRFGEILPDQVPEDAIDLEGATVIPGLWMYTATATPTRISPTEIIRA